ncbi:hypothetical protein, partial [Salmonella enterica]|uniref:hypothetical protein n=1 Tax=Salmonella enterica TaxID=28901 RepID=UPI0035254E88
RVARPITPVHGPLRDRVDAGIGDRAQRQCVRGPFVHRLRARQRDRRCHVGDRNGRRFRIRAGIVVRDGNRDRVRVVGVVVRVLMRLAERRRPRRVVEGLGR